MLVAVAVGGEGLWESGVLFGDEVVCLLARLLVGGVMETMVSLVGYASDGAGRRSWLLPGHGDAMACRE